MHPHRPKLAEFVARELREGIQARKWSEWLPQERLLAEELKVSRSTLRQALGRLQAEGLVNPIRSQGNRIAATGLAATGRRRAGLTVNLLVPTGAEAARPTTVHWIDELRAQLASRGGHLRTLEAAVPYSARPDRALETLVRRNACDCWLVRLSTAPMQRWFERRGLPVIVAGTCHPGVTLPFVDVDHRAVSRHAAAALIAAGHRRLALLVDRDTKAGDLESERGFEEAARSASGGGVEAQVARYHGSVDGMRRQLDRLLAQPRRPTALVVTQAIYCLTIWTHLALRGVRLPDDVSIVSQVGTSELEYLVPRPACYRISLRTYATRILREIEARVAGERATRAALLLPEFAPGESLGPPPAAVR